MPQVIGVVRFGKFTEIINRLPGQSIERDHDPSDTTFRLVDITRRPDIKVGTPWPPPPEPKPTEGGD
jgi:hypothetical protein